MGGCLDGCFNWTGSKCKGLTVDEPIGPCNFYKTVHEAQEGRLDALDASGQDRDRYDRGNKRYWLMDISDEFLAVNAGDLELISQYRSLARKIGMGDRDAAEAARRILHGTE